MNNIHMVSRAGYNIFPIIHDEVFIDLDNIIEGISPNYMVSNYGRVYNKQSQYIIIPNIDKKGYERVTIILSGRPKARLVHRLVMLAFVPIVEPGNFQVNHKNCIKTDNRLCNLEWCTNSENMAHSIENNIHKTGEEHAWNLYEEKMIRLICIGLEQRLPYKEICENILHVEYNPKMKSLISIIKNKKIWIRVSDQYNIPDTNRNDQKFTLEELHYICKCIENNMSTRDILLSMGFNLESFSKSEIKNIFEIIRRIRKKERFCDVSKNYNF